MLGSKRFLETFERLDCLVNSPFDIVGCSASVLSAFEASSIITNTLEISFGIRSTRKCLNVSNVTCTVTSSVRSVSRILPEHVTVKTSTVHAFMNDQASGLTIAGRWAGNVVWAGHNVWEYDCDLVNSVPVVRVVEVAWVTEIKKSLQWKTF